MDYADYMTQLRLAAEADYAAFQSRIVSDTAYPILGVRMPMLRRLAKQASADHWPMLLRSACYESYEEVMFCGLTMAYAPIPLAEKLPYLRALLPKLDSWALTDSITLTLKARQEELPLLFDFAGVCLDDPHGYTVRFGIVLMLHFFLTEEWFAQTATRLTALRDDRYYVNMAVAWCFAEMAVNHFDTVKQILQSGCLDSFTHQKTIQKIRESFRFTKEQKEAITSLRRRSYETNYGN